MGEDKLGVGLVRELDGHTHRLPGSRREVDNDELQIGSFDELHATLVF